MQTAFTILYLASAFILNLTIFSIARFYKKKLDPTSWDGGFRIAILFLFAALITLFTPQTWKWHDSILALTLSFTGIFSIWNCTTLYYTMKQIHK